MCLVASRLAIWHFTCIDVVGYILSYTETSGCVTPTVLIVSQCAWPLCKFAQIRLTVLQNAGFFRGGGAAEQVRQTRRLPDQCLTEIASATICWQVRSLCIVCTDINARTNVMVRM